MDVRFMEKISVLDGCEWHENWKRIFYCYPKTTKLIDWIKKGFHFERLKAVLVRLLSALNELAFNRTQLIIRCSYVNVSLLSQAEKLSARG